MHATLPGGVFAPPLSDQKLARYKELAKTARGDVKEAMEACLRCVEHWWVAPESASGPDASGRIPLDDTLKASLDPHIPWESQVEHFRKLFDGLQEQESARNSAKLEAWRKSLRDHLLSKTLSEEELAWLASNGPAMLRAVMVTIGGFGDAADRYIEPILGAFDVDREFLDGIAAKQRQVDKALADAKANPESAPVAKPILEDVELRNAAFHLLSHVDHLLAGREPVTSDR